MSEGTDEFDHLLSEYRRARVPATISFVIGIPIVLVTILWWQSNPSDARGMVATVVGSVELTAALIMVASWFFTTRTRLMRARRVALRVGGVYHDPSPTRVCPRCGLPMDRAMGGAFYTGPTSPSELCHRCLHSDEP